MKYIVVLGLFLAACTPKIEGPNRFSDNKLVNIYEMQDKRDSKGLLPFLKAKKESHRIAAALAFASIQDTISIPYLNQMLQIDQDPMPRRAAAFALGQIRSIKAIPILKSAFDRELFPPNRPYVMEAIGKCGDSSTIELFENIEYQDSALQMGWAYGVFRLGQKGFRSEKLNNRMMDFLNDDNKDLAILASHYVYRGLRNSADDEQIVLLMNKTRYDEVRDRLYLLLDKQLSKQAEIETKVYGRPWLGKYNNLNNYEKAAAINNLTSKVGNASRLFLPLIKSDSTPSIVRNAAFTKYCEFYPNEKWPIIRTALTSNDMALQSLAALEIQKGNTFSYLNEIKVVKKTGGIREQCEKVKSQLKLPQQAETYIDICNAIEALGGEKFEGYQPEYNHPINWKFVKTIPAKQKVIIKTNKGDIILQLFVNDAPATVANFLQLTDSGFYDNKFFHRVVPQFVIQGGCPRGDGWGGLDWTQRSEFSNYQGYETGTVGIASAGKDTEGVQFFITHCPTPHLDGRYTIFARVIEGIDVVNSINVGDKIESILRIQSKDIETP
jgi:cyclophilin family peptidyl-prolyl cis-trans isomerase